MGQDNRCRQADLIENDGITIMAEQTHFGFQTVDAAQKAGKVAEVFHSVANKYDVMNDFMSAGMHRVWKRFTLDTAGVRPGQKVLDIAGGTGDLARAGWAKRVGRSGEVWLTDINSSMLTVGRDRLADEGCCCRWPWPMPRSCPSQQIILIWCRWRLALRNMTHKGARWRRCCACSSRAASCWCWSFPRCGAVEAGV